MDNARHGPECRILFKEKKELRFDPQNKKKEVRDDQGTFCVIHSVFLSKTQRYPCCTLLSVFFAQLSQKNSLDNTTFFWLSAVMQKSFLLKLLLVAFFFCGCLAKVVLRQRVKKNYCSSNTKVKCVCISIFRKNVLVIHFDNTKNRQLFILTTQKIVS